MFNKISWFMIAIVFAGALGISTYYYVQYQKVTVDTSNKPSETSAKTGIDYNNGQEASALLKGFLSPADWTKFNNKQDALFFNANEFKVTNNNVSIDYSNIPTVGALSNGFLTASDWNTFNNKIDFAELSASGLIIPTTVEETNWNNAFASSHVALTIGTANGLSLTNQALSLDLASAATSGALSSTNWTAFNGKESALTFSTGLSRATNTITSDIATGVTGGQTIYGGTGASEALTIDSTTNTTKGNIILNPTGGNVGIGTTSPSSTLDVSGIIKGQYVYDQKDVVFWGAKGDGVTDDTSAFQQALANSQTVTISKPGTYIINSTLYLGNNQSLIGSNGVTLKRGSDGGQHITMLVANTLAPTLGYMAPSGYNTGIAIKDITFDDGPSGTQTVGTLNGIIQFRYATHVLMQNININASITTPNNTLYAVDLQNTTYSTFSGFNIVNINASGTHGKDGIHLEGGCHDLLFEHIYINSYDDSMALTADDYPRTAGNIADIYNITFRDVTSESGRVSAAGNFTLMLSGSWMDWTSGNTYNIGDKVTYGGQIYKMQNAGPIVATVAPTHTSGVVTGADNIRWRWAGISSAPISTAPNIYTCNVYNIMYDGIYMLDNRPIGREVNAGSFNNNEYPGTLNTSYVDQVSIQNVTLGSGMTAQQVFMRSGGRVKQVGTMLTGNVLIGTSYNSDFTGNYNSSLTVRGKDTGGSSVLNIINSASTILLNVTANGTVTMPGTITTGTTTTVKIDSGLMVNGTGGFGIGSLNNSGQNRIDLNSGTYRFLNSGDSYAPIATASQTINGNVSTTGKVGIGLTVPTALLHLKAGTATLNTAPLKFNSGILLTTPEAGAIEFLTDTFYMTATNGVSGSTQRQAIPGVTTGTAIPATTPIRVGDIYSDTTNKKVYISTGTASSADWTILN